MNVQFINPFIESVNDLFSTMLGCEAIREQVRLTEPVVTKEPLVAVINMSGPVKGTVALIFPLETALAIFGRFSGEKSDRLTADVVDTLAEIANIVAGGAKSKLNVSDTPVNLTMPNVLENRGNTILSPASGTWIEVIFSSALGGFNLRVTMGKTKG